MSQTQPGDTFHVDPWVHHLSTLVSRYPRLWAQLGNLETRLLSESLEGIEVRAPIYVTGLARSGSTLLLEILDWHEQVATHRYRDFPFLLTPCAWNGFLNRVPGRAGAEPAERTHKDGIMVTPESPEAFEEVLWMAFFPELHDPTRSAVLNEETANPRFERFYQDHIRKLLLLRGADRYASKGNYNVTRLEYLLRLFPDARFVIPVRDPVWHIASLMKQHRLFCDGQRGSPRALTHLQRAGHFEFGLDRRPVNAGDTNAIRRIRELWEQGAEVEGWARYWAHIHGHLADRLERNAELRKASLIVRYEQLCDHPVSTVRKLLQHCLLPVPENLLQRARERIHFPTYYRPGFTSEELDIIQQHTDITATRLGLNDALARHA